MNSIAFKMLIGNRAAFIGANFGIFLAILLISQQSAIFLGLLSRSYRIVTEIPQPNVWAIDPMTYGEDLIRPIPKSYREYVRSIPDVEWAVPINYLLLPLATSSNIYGVAEIYGIDDETLIGAPKLLKGNIQDLYRDGGVIIDSNSAKTLAKTLPDGTTTSLTIGDILEINGHRAVIVGIGKTTPGFYPQPVIFALNSQVQKYSGSNRIQYIAVKTRKDADVDKVIQQINSHPNILSMTSDQLESRIASHFLKTGILINFAISVALGLIIGFSIAGQMFYLMTMHNLSYYALIKALGGTSKTILRMVMLQAAIVGVLGYILGTGTTLLWGFATKNTTLAFEFPWPLLVFTGALTLIICIFITVLSIRKIFKLDPQMLMVTL
jgi:putative ABC transport system permease protein